MPLSNILFKKRKEKIHNLFPILINIYVNSFEQFEYQQAQLEAEIENLSWKIERAEMTDRGDLENQMDIVEKRRTTLLTDFLQV